jgi:aldose 1-epimerase
MFQIKRQKKEGKDLIIVSNKIGSTKAEISLNKGGSISNLFINNKQIITDLAPRHYEKTYASSIMFPFANRINNGKYTFMGVEFQLHCNEKESNNALHGLIYNKKFDLIKTSINQEFAEIILSYKVINAHKGFPYSFDLKLSYIIYNSSLKISLNILNIGEVKFPFTVGWHPYFNVDNFDKTELIFDSIQKTECDNRNITTKVSKFKSSNPWIIKNQKIDNAFVIKNNKVILKTGNFTAKIISSIDNNYLQIYTPKNYKAIAVEPMTGLSDSFNNGIGLRHLHKNEKYRVEWLLDVIA